MRQRVRGASHESIASHSALALLWPVSPLAQAAERAIDKSIDVPATLDQAWDAWTTREGIVSFFAPDAKIEARVGGAFHIYIDPGAPAGSKGADDMRFMALQPKQMLSFDWNAPPSAARSARAAHLRHRALRAAGRQADARDACTTPAGATGGEWDKAYAYFDRAWGNVLGNLKKRFEQGPQDWKPWLEQLRRWREAAAASAPAATK